MPDIYLQASAALRRFVGQIESRIAVNPQFGFPKMLYYTEQHPEKNLEKGYAWYPL